MAGIIIGDEAFVYCDDCGAVPVPEDQLPVVLPEDVTFMGVQSPIKADPQWRKTTCPTRSMDPGPGILPDTTACGSSRRT